MRRAVVLRLALTVVVALGASALVAVIVWHANRDDTHAYHRSSDGRATAGEEYVRARVDADPTPATVLLPTGALHLTISTQSDAVDDPSGERYGLRPPKGGSFVEVDAALDPSVSSLPAEDVPPAGIAPTLAVDVGSHRYSLPKTGEGMVLAVDGAARTGRLEVTFDRVTQTVNLATGAVARGLAAPLYRHVASGSADCGAPTYTEPYAAATNGSAALGCRVTWRRIPYVPGSWAPAGQSYLVAAVTVGGPTVVDRLDGRRRTRLSTQDFDASMSVRCGAAPASAVGAGPLTDLRDTTRVFACPATPTTSSTTLTVHNVAAVYDHDADEPVTVSWSVSL